MINFELYNDDSTKKIKDIPDKHIDLTVTSPPYDDLRSYNGHIDQWSEQSWKIIISELYRITKDGGIVVWIVNDETKNGSETGTSFRQALFAKDCGFNLHDTMIWNKGGFSAVGSLQTRYGPVFEYMFVFSKGKIKTFNPLLDRKNKVQGKIKGTIRNRDGSMKSMSAIGKNHREYGQRFNIWDQSSCKLDIDHPARFPLSLCQDHIKSWSNENDTVFDPFLGSGTTGIASVGLNRNFIGIEIDKNYFSIAKTRIEQAHQNNITKFLV